MAVNVRLLLYWIRSLGISWIVNVVLKRIMRSSRRLRRSGESFQSPERSDDDETSYQLDYTHRPSTSRSAASASMHSTADQRSKKNYAKKSTSHGPHGRNVSNSNRNAESTRKRKQIKPKKNANVAFIRNVRMLQNQTGFLIPKMSFGRLVREIVQQESTGDALITKDAVTALQESTEMFMTQVFSDAYLLTTHRKCVTLAVKDIELMKVLKLIDCF